MKIALCDDEQNDLKQLRQHLERYDSSLDVTAFCIARELLSATEHIFFNLIFLDIEMEAPNCFESARQLMSRSETPLIIFTTKSAEYSIAGYGLAFRYLKKPISYPVMEEVLHLALEQLIPQQASFPIGGAEKVFSVSTTSIFINKAGFGRAHGNEKTCLCSAGAEPDVSARIYDHGLCRNKTRGRFQ